MRTQPLSRTLIAVSVALLMAGIACNLPPAGQVTQSTVITAPTQAATSTSPGATQPPAATSAPTTALGGDATAESSEPTAGPTATMPTGDVPTITLDPSAPQANTTTEVGISFYLDLDLFSDWRYDIVPRQAPGTDNPYALPSHYRFDFGSYPVANDYIDPQMWVFPTRNITEEYPSVQADWALLRTFLTARQPDLTGLGENLPTLPPINAAQIIRAQVAYLEFPSGKGLRYLTQHDQAFLPINNRELFYTFQGLTDDGQYYISVRLPVTHPDLIDEFDMNNPPADFKAAMDANNPDPYFQAIIDLLNAADPEDFRPDLSQLDAFIQSIRIER